MKIWVEQTGTGQNLGGCSRFKGATAKENGFISEKPEYKYRIRESSRPRWSDLGRGSVTMGSHYTGRRGYDQCEVVAHIQIYIDIYRYRYRYRERDV